MIKPLSFTVVVPARLSSSRLANKPLVDIAGKPMVVRVAERAAQSLATRVVVATDHQSIVEACAVHGIEALMTDINHTSGTERLAEAAMQLGLASDDLVVNVQGDEPLLEPLLVNRVAQLLANSRAPVATAAHTIRCASEFFNPNVVKVVLDANSNALYFSRAPIPWDRDALALDKSRLPNDLPALRHIGIYGYRVEFLQRYAALTPSPLEKIEALEQLRILWHGYHIAVAHFDEEPLPGVDTAEDLERVRAYFAEQ